MKIETIITTNHTHQKITGLPNSALVLKALVDDRKRAGYRLVAVKPADEKRQRCIAEFEKGSEPC